MLSVPAQGQTIENYLVLWLACQDGPACTPAHTGLKLQPLLLWPCFSLKQILPLPMQGQEPGKGWSLGSDPALSHGEDSVPAQKYREYSQYFTPFYGVQSITIPNHYVVCLNNIVSQIYFNAKERKKVGHRILMIHQYLSTC